MNDDDADWADDDELTAPRRRRWLPRRSGPPAIALDGLPASQMRGNEASITYAIAAVAFICAVILLADHTGKGAPRHPDPIWAALGAAAAVAVAVTVRWHNRLMSASAALIAGFLISNAKGPTSLTGLRDVGFFVPALGAMYLYIRQTSADKARRKAGLDPARGRRGGASAKATATATTKPTVGGAVRGSGRYTAPKDRTPPKSGAKRR